MWCWLSRPCRPWSTSGSRPWQSEWGCCYTAWSGARTMLLAVDQRRGVSLDVALLVAIVGFASTVAFAQYLVAVAADDEPPDDRAGP